MSYYDDRELERELDAAEEARHRFGCDCYECWPPDVAESGDNE